MRAAAAELARQHGQGVSRSTLVGLAAAKVSVSVLRPEMDGDPVVAIVSGVAAHQNELFCSLTPRESEVAGLVAHGHSNKRIAAVLDISVATVKDHVHRILEKTGLSSRAAVAAEWQRR